MHLLLLFVLASSLIFPVPIPLNSVNTHSAPIVKPHTNTMSLAPKTLPTQDIPATQSAQITAVVESYNIPGSFKQTVQEAKIDPGPNNQTNQPPNQPSSNTADSDNTQPNSTLALTESTSPQATSSANTTPSRGVLQSTSQNSATQYAPTNTPTPIQPSQSDPAISFEDVYKQAGAKFGVPWQILYGIHQTETGCRNGPISSYSGSGAQGPMQFMPATWKAYGVDGDGDGVADINNAADAIYSAANFIAKHGSVMAGLHAYGGDTAGILELAKEKGYTP